MTWIYSCTEYNNSEYETKMWQLRLGREAHDMAVFPSISMDTSTKTSCS